MITYHDMKQFQFSVDSGVKREQFIGIAVYFPRKLICVSGRTADIVVLQTSLQRACRGGTMGGRILIKGVDIHVVHLHHVCIVRIYSRWNSTGLSPYIQQQ